MWRDGKRRTAARPDHLASRGNWRGVNRTSILVPNAVLASATVEDPIKHIKNASFTASCDPLEGSSASVLTGCPVTFARRFPVCCTSSRSETTQKEKTLETAGTVVRARPESPEGGTNGFNVLLQTQPIQPMSLDV